MRAEINLIGFNSSMTIFVAKVVCNVFLNIHLFLLECLDAREFESLYICMHQVSLLHFNWFWITCKEFMEISLIGTTVIVFLFALIYMIMQGRVL